MLQLNVTRKSTSLLWHAALIASRAFRNANCVSFIDEKHGNPNYTCVCTGRVAHNRHQRRAHRAQTARTRTSDTRDATLPLISATRAPGQRSITLNAGRETRVCIVCTRRALCAASDLPCRFQRVFRIYLGGGLWFARQRVENISQTKTASIISSNREHNRRPRSVCKCFILYAHFVTYNRTDSHLAH